MSLLEIKHIYPPTFPLPLHIPNGSETARRHQWSGSLALSSHHRLQHSARLPGSYRPLLHRVGLEKIAHDQHGSTCASTCCSIEHAGRQPCWASVPRSSAAFLTALDWILSLQTVVVHPSAISDSSVIDSDSLCMHIWWSYRFMSLIPSYIILFTCPSVHDPIIIYMKILLNLKHIMISRP